jgi:anti-sigma B factor antagonist
MDIQVRERDGITILKPEGRLVLGTVEAFRERVTQLAAEGRVNQVIDLGAVQYIDSTGLGGLVICYNALKKAGGNLRMFNLNKRNVELLALTRLHQVFEVFTDEDDAVNSFFPERKVSRFDILAFVQSQQARDEDE